MVRDRLSVAAYQAPALKYEFPLGDPSRSYAIAKRAIDVLVAAAGLLLMLPLLVVISLAVLTDGRPIFFRQIRLGEQGRPFTLTKFRTMRAGANPYARKPGVRDERVTAVGKVLRRTGLDEIPQLWNVLKGEMSLVGPRPEMPFIADSYDWVARLRLHAPPGITGLWQLSPVRLQPIHDHVEYDLFFLAHRSLLFDLWIIVRTPLVLFFGRHIVLDRGLVERWGHKYRIERPAHRVVLDLSQPVATLADVAGPA